MNSTETPGGSGIPAGWYDDPSGDGLRWWDGERWTEHVHSAESAEAATAAGGDGEREGAPPRDLLKLRESIRARGVKAVGMVVGAAVLVVVVIALLVSGGSESSSPPANAGSSTGTGNGAAAKVAQIEKIEKKLRNKNLSAAQKKHLKAQKKKLEQGGASAQGQSGTKKQKE